MGLVVSNVNPSISHTHVCWTLWVVPCTRRQFITGPHRGKYPFTLRYTPSTHSFQCNVFGLWEDTGEQRGTMKTLHRRLTVPESNQQTFCYSVVTLTTATPSFKVIEVFFSHIAHLCIVMLHLKYLKKTLIVGILHCIFPGLRGLCNDILWHFVFNHSLSVGLAVKGSSCCCWLD